MILSIELRVQQLPGPKNAWIEIAYPLLGLEQQSSSGSSNSGRIKLAKTQKKSAINDFKERLKSRFQSFRNRANEASPRTSFR